jgi:hypothetical protein
VLPIITYAYCSWSLLTLVCRKLKKKKLLWIFLPAWWSGNNSPNVAHACRKRRLKCVPGVSGYNWATLPPGDINRGQVLQIGGWAWGWQSHPIKKLLGNLRRPKPRMVFNADDQARLRSYGLVYGMFWPYTREERWGIWIRCYRNTEWPRLRWLDSILKDVKLLKVEAWWKKALGGGWWRRPRSIKSCRARRSYEYSIRVAFMEARLTMFLW